MKSDESLPAECMDNGFIKSDIPDTYKDNKEDNNNCRNINKIFSVSGGTPGIYTDVPLWGGKKPGECWDRSNGVPSIDRLFNKENFQTVFQSNPVLLWFISIFFVVIVLFIGVIFVAENTGKRDLSNNLDKFVSLLFMALLGSYIAYIVIALDNHQYKNENWEITIDWFNKFLPKDKQITASGTYDTSDEPLGGNRGWGILVFFILIGLFMLILCAVWWSKSSSPGGDPPQVGNAPQAGNAPQGGNVFV